MDEGKGVDKWMDERNVNGEEKGIRASNVEGMGCGIRPRSRVWERERG